MFFAINKIEQGAHHANGLENPQNPGNPMVLGVYRRESRTVLFTVNSKNASAEFWDNTLQKQIPQKVWTSEMKAFAAQKIAQTPKPSFFFKITIFGWFFVLLICAVFGLMIYESIKPPAAKPDTFLAMEQKPVPGDLYFGRYEIFKEAQDRIASTVGFGWFKVVKTEGDIYYLAKSTETSINHKPKETLNSTDFEAEAIPLNITEHEGYMINMKTADGNMKIYITDKK